MQVAFLACLAVLVLAPAVRAQAQGAPDDDDEDNLLGGTPVNRNVPKAETNIAFRKKVTMSGLYSTWDGKRATDGNKDASSTALTTAMTNSQQFPWLAVDLEAVYRVSSVALYNYGSSASRLDNAMVSLSDVKPPPRAEWDLQHEGFWLCNKWPKPFEGSTANKPSVIKQNCLDNQAIGRYVYVWRPVKDYMHLVEIEVFGTLSAKTRGRPVRDMSSAAPLPGGPGSALVMKAPGCGQRFSNTHLSEQPILA